MTITVSKAYEAGQSYKMFVRFVNPHGKYINVADKDNGGE